jgi:hypothetical protein
LVPEVTPGDLTVSDVDVMTDGETVYTTLDETGVPPDSETKFTVAPVVKPVPTT